MPRIIEFHTWFEQTTLSPYVEPSRLTSLSHGDVQHVFACGHILWFANRYNPPRSQLSSLRSVCGGTKHWFNQCFVQFGSIHSPWRQDLRRAGCVARIILQNYRFRWLVNSSRPTVYYWRRYLPSAGVITLRYSYGLGLLGEKLLRQELDWGG